MAFLVSELSSKEVCNYSKKKKKKNQEACPSFTQKPATCVHFFMKRDSELYSLYAVSWEGMINLADTIGQQES